MNWFILAIASSIFLSTRELSVKKAGKDISPGYMSWGLNFFMFLVILLINLIMRNYHEVTFPFIKVLIIASILDSAATFLYLASIKFGDLSKTIPMLCFIPVVQLFVTPALIEERLTFTGIIGVLTVVFGSYILNIEKWDGMFSPIKRVAKNKSSVMMLAVAVMWGTSSSFHKIGIQMTDALFWGLCEIGVISFFFLPFAVKSTGVKRFISNAGKTVLPGVFSSITVITYYMAISMGPVAYVSSVRRLGVLFTVLMGILIFKEKKEGLGFAGGLIMIAGAAIISIFG